MPPKAAIHLNNDYRVATQKDKVEMSQEQRQLLRTGISGYAVGFTAQFLRDMAPLDRNKLQGVWEKMTRVLE